MELKPQAQNRYINKFDIKGLLDLYKIDFFNSLNCHAIATVQTFDSATQTVTATINYDQTLLGQQIPYPILIDCPVVILTGGNASLTFPIAKGDTCLILFNDKDMDGWYASGQVGQNPTNRSHSFSDAIALVGLRSKLNKLATYDTTRATLQHGTTSVGVSATKIRIKNNSTTLNTLLQSLITDLTTLTTILNTLTTAMAAATPANVVATVGVPSATAAASIASLATTITTLGTQIGGLLE